MQIKLSTITVVLGLAAMTNSVSARRAVPTLDPSNWEIILVDGQAVTGRPNIRFERGRVSGSSGCNSFSGAFHRTGTTLSFEPVIATQMACPNPLGAQEAAVFSLLSPRVQIRFPRDSVMLLSNGAHRAELRKLTPKPLQLADRAWIILSINGKAPTRRDKAEISFTKDRLSATVGCNTLGASYQLQRRNQIVTGAVISTRMACPNIMREEAALGALLNNDPQLMQIDATPDAPKWRLTDGRNEVVLLQKWHVGLD